MEISDQPVKLQDAVAIGQEIQAIIKRFRPQERKISLSIKDLNRGAEAAEDAE
jgi:ribosomal protein S1